MVEDISIDLTRHDDAPSKASKPVDLAKSLLKPLTFSVSGMTCSSCVNAIERALNSIDGVSASVNFASETVHVLAPEEIKSGELVKKIKGAGYEAVLLEDSTGPALHNKKSGVALFFAVLFAINLIFHF